MRILINGTFQAGAYSMAELLRQVCTQRGSAKVFSSEDYRETGSDFEIVVVNEYTQNWVDWADKIFTIFREPDQVLHEIGLPNYYPKTGVDNIDFDLRNLYRPLTYWGFYCQYADYCAKYEQLTRSPLKLATIMGEKMGFRVNLRPLRKEFQHNDMKLIDTIDFDVLSFNRICEKIRNGEHFSLARYGDGEFNAILGVQGANCDGHEYFPEMGQELADTLRSNPDYYIGMHQNARIEQKTLDWLNENGLKDRKFVSNAVLHCALRDGLFDQFWNATLGRKVLIIGPQYIEQQKKINGHFLSIPAKNTYEYLPAIKMRLDSMLPVGLLPGSIVLICASMTAPLIVDHLYKQYGNTATFIDFGSCFDPYCGIKSRSFHKNVLK